MQTLYLAKNKYGNYYAKISNQNQKCDLIVSVNFPRKDMQLDRDFGKFNCDYYLSCYKGNNGEVKPVIKITKFYDGVAMDVNETVNPDGAKSLDPYEEYNSEPPF